MTKQSKRLTPKQELFIKEYLVDFNATRAAISAGYKEKTAYAIGAENLRKPQIISAIQNRQKELSDKVEITQEKVLAEYAKIAFIDVNKNELNGIVKASDKLRALQDLAKHLGLFEKDNSQKTMSVDQIFSMLSGVSPELASGVEKYIKENIIKKQK